MAPPSTNNDTRYRMVKTMVIVIIYFKNEPFFDNYNFEDILNSHGFFANAVWDQRCHLEVLLSKQTTKNMFSKKYWCWKLLEDVPNYSNSISSSRKKKFFIEIVFNDLHKSYKLYIKSISTARKWCLIH